MSAFSGSMTWRADDLRDEEWCFELTDAVRLELERAMFETIRGRIPITVQRPADFALDAAGALMARVRHALRQGRGFALVSRLPVEDWGQEGSTLAYWLLSGLVARPVAQNVSGTLIYDVQDTDRKPEPGSGVRPDKTNVEQYFHNDNAYNRCQPDYVGLLCLRPALEGGRSGVASIRTIHNELKRSHPDSLSRLYQPFLFDRQNEHAFGEPQLVSAPIFANVEGELKMRMGLYPLLNAYELPGQQLDAEGARAISSLKDVLSDPTLCHNFSMASGEIQFVNNLGTCHRRTSYRDDPKNRRHLVRLWLRDQGSRCYEG